jgi:hypothetical protein
MDVMPPRWSYEVIANLYQSMPLAGKLSRQKQQRLTE